MAARGVVLSLTSTPCVGAVILPPSDYRLGHEELAAYARPRLRRSVLDVITLWCRTTLTVGEYRRGDGEVVSLIV
jgi:hypothetical protein